MIRCHVSSDPRGTGRMSVQVGGQHVKPFTAIEEALWLAKLSNEELDWEVCFYLRHFKGKVVIFICNTYDAGFHHKSCSPFCMLYTDLSP